MKFNCIAANIPTARDTRRPKDLRRSKRLLGEVTENRRKESPQSRTASSAPMDYSRTDASCSLVDLLGQKKKNQNATLIFSSFFENRIQVRLCSVSRTTHSFIFLTHLLKFTVQSVTIIFMMIAHARMNLDFPRGAANFE